MLKKRPESSEKTIDMLAERVSILPVLCTQLRETLRQMDESVGGVCGNFHGISHRAKESVARASEFLGAGTESGAQSFGLTGLISHTQETLGSLLDNSARASQQAAAAIERLQCVSQVSEQIKKAVASLNEMAIGNKLVAVNARIEAARLGAQAAGFNVVADEILAQTRFSTSVVETVQGLTAELNSAATKTIEILRANVEQDRETLEKSRREVDHALERFSTMLESARKFADESAQNSQRLADDISSAIRGLQFHDRTNQRVQHVIEELEDIHLSLAPEVALDAGRQEQALRRLSQRYTMAEEHSVESAQTVSSGDVELF